MLSSVEFWLNSSSCAVGVQGFTEQNHLRVLLRVDHPFIFWPHPLAPAVSGSHLESLVRERIKQVH